MLAQLRAMVKSPIITALLALLLASFLLWGIRDVFRFAGPGGGDAVVQAGSRSISPARFQQMFQDELKSYAQQTGQTISPQDAVRAGLDRQIVDAIALDESFAEYLRRTGVRPGDKLVVDEIRKAPRFFNPVSGMFDKRAYEMFVQQQLGMSDAQFEGLLRDQLAQGQFVAGVAAGLQAPRLYDALVAASQDEGRTFGYFLLPQSAVPAPAQPTEAEMDAFLTENAARLKRPEMRLLTVVNFSTAAAASGASVAPADVQKRFDFEKDSLSTAEKRSLVEIPVRSTADAARAAAALRDGEAPAAVASSVGTQPVTYADQPKSAIADPKVAAAAFALKPGEVSGAVQGDLGLAVLKLVSVTPGHVETLDEARPKIEAEVRNDAARAKVDQEVRKYEDARSGGADLVQAAKSLGVAPTPVGPVTAQGADAKGHPAQIAPKVLQAAFALPPGGDSDIVDLGQGEYAAVKVEKMIAPAPPSLDEVRPQLTKFLMARDLQTRLAARAEALADQIRHGKSLEAVAASVGAAPGDGVGVERANAGQTFSQQLLAQLFQAKVGDVVVGPDVKGAGVMVARLKADVPASGPAAAQTAANQGPAMTRSLLQDLGQAVRTAAREVVKPRIDYKRARTAVGGDANPTP